MASVNKAILIGNLGADPESRPLNSGGKVVTMRIATSESWKDRGSGERRERTEWHTVVIFNEPLAKVAEQYLRKGSKVYVEGQLQTRKWQDREGNDRYSTEVVLQAFNSVLVLLDKQQGDPGRHDYSGHARDGGAQAGAEAGWSGERPGSGASQPPGADLDDDVPF